MNTIRMESFKRMIPDMDMIPEYRLLGTRPSDYGGPARAREMKPTNDGQIRSPEGPTAPDLLLKEYRSRVSLCNRFGLGPETWPPI